MALIERRADGGNVAFSRSIRWIEPVCGPSFGYLRLLGRYGCGNRWSSILRMVSGLMPLSRATCRIETPFRRTRSRIPDHCATSRYMLGPWFHPFARELTWAKQPMRCATVLPRGRPPANVQPIDANACFPRLTFSMIAFGSAVQKKGFGLLLVSARYRLMAVWRSTMPLNTPRLSRCLLNLAKNPSTALSQDADVGVKWKWNLGCRSSQARTLGCLCVA